MANSFFHKLFGQKKRGRCWLVELYGDYEKRG